MLDGFCTHGTVNTRSFWVLEALYCRFNFCTSLVTSFDWKIYFGWRNVGSWSNRRYVEKVREVPPSFLHYVFLWVDNKSAKGLDLGSRVRRGLTLNLSNVFPRSFGAFCRSANLSSAICLAGYYDRPPRRFRRPFDRARATIVLSRPCVSVGIEAWQHYGGGPGPRKVPHSSCYPCKRIKKSD